MNGLSEFHILSRTISFSCNMLLHHSR